MSIAALWVLAGLGLIASEVLTPTAFVLVSFGIGAFAAGAVALSTSNAYASWVTFFGVGSASISVIWRLAKQWTAKV